MTLLSGILNARRRFAAAAAAPVLLNVSLLAALALAFLFPNAGYAAAWGVAVSGVLQFLLVWADARRAGLAPSSRAPDPGRCRHAPVLPDAGAGGDRLGRRADRDVRRHDHRLVPADRGGLGALLRRPDRLYQLPFGVIGIAAGTVLLPEMSRRVAANDPDGAHAAQNRATGFSLALSAPFAVAFLLVPDLIMTALFQRGAFDAEAASRSGAVLAAYGLALPAAVLIRSIVASFYARHDTRTPVVASLTAVAVNVGLKVVLTGPLGVMGWRSPPRRASGSTC